MKYYDIVIESGRSQELKEKLPEIESFLKSQELNYKVFYTSQGNPEEPETISLLINDFYNSEELSELRKQCKKANYKKADEVVNSSRNLFQAYLKASERLQKLQEKKKRTSEESGEMMEMRTLIATIKEEVFQLALFQYKTLSESIGEAALDSLKTADKGITKSRTGDIEYFQTIGPITGSSEEYYTPISKAFRKAPEEGE